MLPRSGTQEGGKVKRPESFGKHFASQKTKPDCLRNFWAFEPLVRLAQKRLSSYILIKLCPAGGAESSKWMRRRLSKRGDDLFLRHIR
jgi:hypothetical protein